jgi:hypothetical protein
MGAGHAGLFSRENYAGTSLISRASGKSHTVQAPCHPALHRLDNRLISRRRRPTR